MDWFQKAADQGYASAQNNLALMYRDGLGVTQSYEKAMDWFQKAADQGYASAQNNLAGMYRDGLGVPISFENSIAWYQKAADQGNATAQKRLDNFYVIINDALIRNGAKNTSKVKRSILSGNIVYVSKTSNSWVKVQTEYGISGWIPESAVMEISKWNQEDADKNESGQFMRIKKNTQLKTAPDQSESVKQNLMEGDVVLATGENIGSWIKVKTNEGFTGWILVTDAEKTSE